MVKIGFPISKNPDKQTLSESISSYHEMGMTAFQVCMTPSHNGLNGKKLSDTENARIIELKKTKNIYGVVHGKYLYNFCRKECSYQIDQLVHELELSNDIECDVIIHQGKNVPEEHLTRLEALNNYVKHVSEALEKTYDLTNGILLENSAKQGNELGYSLEELSYIYNQFDDSVKHRVGFCLDLCHIFVAGELDLRKADAVELFFVQFDSLIGLDKLKCIHFNDSSIPFAGRNDNHGDLHCGYVTNPLLGGSIEGFRLVAEMAEQHNIAVIFETPCGFNKFHKGNQIMWQLQIVSGWANKTNLPYLTYVQLHPELSQIAQYYYVNRKEIKKKGKVAAQNKKQAQTSIPSQTVTPPKLELCDCGDHQTPKIKIKLKIKLKNQSELQNQSEQKINQ